jgi:hypothetical protein
VRNGELIVALAVSSAFALGCDRQATAAPESDAGATASSATVQERPPAGSDDAPDAAAPTVPDVAPVAACGASSVALLKAPDDARVLAALGGCSPYDPYVAMCDDEQPNAAMCGQQGHTRAVDVARMIASALPLDPATTAHVRGIFAAGRAKGRRADVFALLGDSITIDHSFLRPFGVASIDQRVVLSPEVRDALRIDADRTVVDLFRGVAIGDAGRGSYDSFRAKIGARARWALTYSTTLHATPIEDIVATLSPAYAVVMYGTNDAQWFTADQIGKDFGVELRSIVDQLEARGVVPILTTIPKHLRDKRFADCPVAGSTSSNWRYAIQTNMANAVIAAVACERQLPLIDYRYALEPLLAHGVGPDGVHPSLYYKGGGVLDESGLQCGFNVRNFVTLRMLKIVRDAALAE